MSLSNIVIGILSKDHDLYLMKRGQFERRKNILCLRKYLSAIIFFSLPLWKKKAAMNTDAAAINAEQEKKPLSLIEIVKIDGVVHILLMFFCYCALEATAMLWASSYMVLHSGIDPKTAAFFARTPSEFLALASSSFFASSASLVAIICAAR